MGKWGLSVVLLLAVACGDDGGGADSDAGPQVDAAPEPLCPAVTTERACDPMTQVGCGDCEKCATVRLDDESRELCVADNRVELGGECVEYDSGVANGVDDCAAAGQCDYARCRPFCTATGRADVQGSCSGGQLCSGNFLGTCVDTCDPVAGIDRSSGSLVVDDSAQCGADSCYFSYYRGTGWCIPPKEGQLPAHEEVCPRPCGRNGCAPGHSRSKPTGTLAEWQEQFQFRALLGFEEVCVQMCDTTETAINGGPEGEFRGDCPDGSECKIANGLFFNIFAGPDIDPDPPTSIGICISTSQFPSCANHQLGDIGAYFVQPGQTRDPAGVGADNLYIPGCSPKATMLQKSEHCYDGEPDVPPGTFGDSPCAEPAAAPL